MTERAAESRGEVEARCSPDDQELTSIEPEDGRPPLDDGSTSAAPSGPAEEELVAADDPVHDVPLPARLEAVLLVADQPVSEGTLAQVVGESVSAVGEALDRLSAEYDAQGRGFELRQVAGGWRFYTRASCATVVERYVRDGQSARLTQAALETLAVVAYRQPVTRARISAVRGVNVDGVVRTLLARGLITEAGADPDSAGTLYRTTPLLLEKLGLRSLEELPSLAPLLPEVEEFDNESSSA